MGAGRHDVVSTCKGEFMTRFYVNDREISAPSDATSLNQVLKHVESSYLPPNSVVRQIQIDGFPVMPDADSVNQPGMLGQIETREKIEFYTGTLVEIAHDSISGALEYLDRIEAATPSLAESFRTYPGAEAFESLRQLFEGFYWLNILLGKLETSFQVKLQEMNIRDASATDYYQKFITILKQLVAAQENGDFIMISDLLEYEILPLVPIWREMLGLIAEKVSTTQ
jgi:hypothetical protein